MEEQVGILWHRFVTRLANVDYPDAEITLNEIKSALGIFFRALGGDPGLQLEAIDKTATDNRRTLIQRLAGTHKTVELAQCDDNALKLPPRLACFPDKSLNRDLYFWLAALATIPQQHENWFIHNQLAVRQTLLAYPGLNRQYERLLKAHLAQRPGPATLPADEQAIERQIRKALECPGQPLSAEIFCLPVKHGHYPVLLWLSPESTALASTQPFHDAADSANDPGSQQTREPDETVKRKAEQTGEPEDDRGLVTIRMENILTLGEFINLDRGSEEEEDLEQAETAARELEKISVSRERKSLASRLKFDLDLPAADEDDIILDDTHLLPEWDWKKQCLIADCCRVVELVNRDTENLALPRHLSGIASKLKKQFQSLKPEKTWHQRQQDGQDIDLEAWLRFMSDKQAGHDRGSDHLYRELRQGSRDLSCLLLADLSLSTDTWIDDRHQVIDIIRDSLYLFSESLNATGDRFAIYGFSTRKRDPIRLHTIKTFEEKYHGEIRGRIHAIKPGYYTRMGAGIRYATRKLLQQASQQRLLLILTDGKPNDLDKYEGRFGIEDTRQAVLEAKRAGLQPFCVTIDKQANEYLPHLFGHHGYVVIKKPAELPGKLPLLYARLTE